MRKILIGFFSTIVIALSGGITSFAQDGADVPDLTPIEIMLCTYRDGMDSDDHDNAMDEMKEWMEENGTEPYAAWRLNPFYAGNQEFDFVYLGAWSNGSSMGRDITQYGGTAGDAIEAANEVADCGIQSMYTSLNVKEPDGDGTGNFVLTVTDCSTADGRSTRDAIDALVEYGEYRDASGSPGGTWVWFPTYSDGSEDFDFKVANSYSSIEAFGNNFQWNRDNQAYIKRLELFSGLLGCNVARSYIGNTIVNTIPSD